jgi:hypothetical protein
MKIKEVILEAPANYNSTAYTNSPLWNNVGPSVKSPNGTNIPLWPSASLAARTGAIPPRAQRQSGKRASALRKKNIRQIIDKLYMGGIPTGKPSKNPSALSQTTAGKHVIEPRMKALLDSKYAIFRNGARFLRLLQWLGLIEFANAWWKDRAALVVLRDLPPDDPQYAEMHITDEQFDMYTDRLAEEFIVKLAASSIMPGILRWFIRTVTLGRYFVAFFGAAGGVTAFASITLLIASETAMLLFQNWLNSPQGKLAVSKAVASLIDPGVELFAAGVSSIWDRIKALVVGEEEKKPEAKPTTTPAAKEKPTTSSNPSSNSSEPSTSTAKPDGQAAKPTPTNAPKTDWSTEKI